MARYGHRALIDGLLGELEAACLEVYGDRLVSLVVFGSVGRGSARPDSDVDLLVVANRLPEGRMPRVEEFAEVERRLRPVMSAARDSGLETYLSPIFKTPDEVRIGSPLFLDMVEDSRLLIDRDGFFADELARLAERLATLGARRVRRAGGWYWDLKPDYRPGDIFEL